MKTIEARITISEDRRLTVQLPRDVEPGEYCVAIILDEVAETSAEKTETADVLHDCGTHPEDL